MGRRTDTRERIIRSSLDEMRHKGFASTAISDIVRASGAPRGSVTFHFPGGKDEIAREVVELRGSQVLAGVGQAAAQSSDAAEFITVFLGRVADDFTRSGFVAGCPVAPIAIDRVPESADLARASSEFFTQWLEAIKSTLEVLGVEPARAQGIATVAVCAIEGALVIGRIEGTSDALGRIRDQLLVLLESDAGDAGS